MRTNQRSKLIETTSGGPHIRVPAGADGDGHLAPPRSGFETNDQLDAVLSTPTDQTIAALSELDGDIIILGAAGKMGPVLANMARRASSEAGVSRRIIGVSRFTNSAKKSQMQSLGIETISGNLLDQEFICSLPDVKNVLYLVGMKFGTSGAEPQLWATNAYLPGLVSNKYRNSRITVFSSGNVYGFASVASRGAIETDIPDPQGDYAMSVLGRERVFEYFSRANQTEIAIIRLNYATELR